MFGPRCYLGVVRLSTPVELLLRLSVFWSIPPNRPTIVCEKDDKRRPADRQRDSQPERERERETYVQRGQDNKFHLIGKHTPGYDHCENICVWLFSLCPLTESHPPERSSNVIRNSSFWLYIFYFIFPVLIFSQLVSFLQACSFFLPFPRLSLQFSDSEFLSRASQTALRREVPEGDCWTYFMSFFHPSRVYLIRFVTCWLASVCVHSSMSVPIYDPTTVRAQINNLNILFLPFSETRFYLSLTTKLSNILTSLGNQPYSLTCSSYISFISYLCDV